MSAVRFKIRATETTLIRQFMGRSLQWTFLNPMYQHALGENAQPTEAFHAIAHKTYTQNQISPYTTSDLFQSSTDGTQPLRGKVLVGEVAWFRIGALNDDATLILNTVQKTAFHNLSLDQGKWYIEEIKTDPSTPGLLTYEQLWTRVQTQPLSKHVRIEVNTPVFFRQLGRDFLSPDPRLIIQNLLQKWNAFSPIPFPEDVAELAPYVLNLKDYNLRTRSIRFKNQSQSGFQGWLEWEIGKPPQKLSKTRPELSRELARRKQELNHILTTLLLYANYAGIGKKTTAGMGLVQTVVR